MSEQALAGRILLVAGGSRGLGAAVALEAARRGARPVVLGRTRGALEELDDRIRAVAGEATLVPLDLADGDAVDRLGPSLYARFGRLDGFVFAAAELGTLGPLSHLDPAEVARVVGTGALAFQRLVRTLEPLLKASPAPRCVVVGDPIATAPRAYWGAYAAAKAALEAMALAWADELERSPLRIVVVEPGPIATRLRRRAFPGEPADAQPAPEAYAGAICALLAPGSTRHGERIALQPARSSA
ncbi:MAG: SDR family NAD(P)-dependent oxidoreductase [Geminicoccaceae bacterium]|nr:SDR family NAD(P)-dependent oxidoreductase [Geminicoccaceae bacterium]MCX8102142.1 SDR family NAD(P)-dependent oxidoreductase [Geminicoccaceae bacterium]MDW8370302.1 SDR family NAD(P)-dependent oxidoreductase [Geminicoccaceae bacterium]